MSSSRFSAPYLRNGFKAALLGASCFASGIVMADSSALVAPKEPTVASVTVAPVTSADFVGQVSISGTLVARDEVLVYPLVSGPTIKELLVEVGDSVQAGDILATLDDATLDAQRAQSEAELARAQASVSQARSQIASSKANATQAEATLQRAQALRSNGSGTQASLDQATAAALTAQASVTSAENGLLVSQAQLQQAQSSLKIAKLNLDRATLRAPADGLVSARNGQIGGVASSGGEPIYRIIRNGHIELEAEVIETALGSIAVGDAAKLSIAGLGDIDGTVRRISPTVDPRNRLGTIRIEVSGEGNLRSGLFASGQIITDERASLSVPTAAILTDNSGTYVLRVVDGRLEKRSVRAGLIWQGNREVIDGLSEGDFVVARAGAFFGDGDEINPIFPDAASTQGASE